MRVDHEIFDELDDISFLLRTFDHFIYELPSLFIRISDISLESSVFGCLDLSSTAVFSEGL